MMKEASTDYQRGHKVPVTGTHIVARTALNVTMNRESKKSAIKEGELSFLTRVESLPGVFRTNTGLLVVMPK